MNVRLTQNRIDRINNCVVNYLQGKKSYIEAFSDAKAEGILGYFRNYYNKSKIISIKEQFLATLQESQVNTSISGIYKLQEILESDLSKKDTQEIHILYQTTYSSINFENSNISLSISNVEIDEKDIAINIKIFDKINKQSDTYIYKIQSKIPQIKKDRILAEFQIFNHKQFGSPITLDAGHEKSTEVTELVTDYIKNQAKFQYDAICCPGGGGRLIGILGVLCSIGEYRLKEVNSVSGASAGALIASLVSAGMKPYELFEFIGTTNLNVSQAQIRELIRTQMSTSIVNRLNEYKDRNDSIKLTKEQENLLIKFDYNKDITFADLQELIYHFPEVGFKKLFVNAHLISSNPSKDIELSVNTCPDMPISLAAISSAALPLLFKPVDATEFFSNDARSKLGINTESIRLNDGGIVSNIPYKYLDAKTPLIISFEDEKSLYKKSLSTFEKIKNYLAGAPAYIYRRADIYELENRIMNPFYLNVQKIKTTSFKEASRQVIVLNQAIKDDFIKYQIITPLIHNQVAKDAKILNNLKFSIYPMYYSGNSRQKALLNSIYKDNKTYFKFLNETVDVNEFDECNNRFQVLNELQNN